MATSVFDSTIMKNESAQLSIGHYHTSVPQWVERTTIDIIITRTDDDEVSIHESTTSTSNFQVSGLAKVWHRSFSITALDINALQLRWLFCVRPTRSRHQEQNHTNVAPRLICTDNYSSVKQGSEYWQDKIESEHSKPIINKCVSTAGAVRVEANLPGTSSACAILNSKCITRKCLTCTMKVKVT